MTRHDWDAVDASLEARLHACALRIALGSQLLYTGVDFDLEIGEHVGLSLGCDAAGDVVHIVVEDDA